MVFTVVPFCPVVFVFFFFFNDTATTEIYTLSLHDALPILAGMVVVSGIGFAFLRDRDTDIAKASLNTELPNEIGRAHV